MQIPASVDAEHLAEPAYRGFGMVPRLRDGTEASGWYRGFGMVPRLRDGTEASGWSCLACVIKRYRSAGDQPPMLFLGCCSPKKAARRKLPAEAFQLRDLLFQQCRW
jgi:hypothetical protein